MRLDRSEWPPIDMFYLTPSENNVSANFQIKSAEADREALSELCMAVPSVSHRHIFLETHPDGIAQADRQSVGHHLARKPVARACARRGWMAAKAKATMQ
ncbi:hypothetical protein VP1G_06298 [Cytospora mali]|uniref:Uncharacterized protein n=1 Tax=Cytospora mali TaxID=578113 RepID=A0A194V520_CYTMA|nr:hypothetical protein VP1G_06298 [Valsa mali var. pyri (nom. inval.)]